MGLGLTFSLKEFPSAHKEHEESGQLLWNPIPSRLASQFLKFTITERLKQENGSLSGPLVPSCTIICAVSPAQDFGLNNHGDGLEQTDVAQISVKVLGMDYRHESLAS